MQRFGAVWLVLGLSAACGTAAPKEHFAPKQKSPAARGGSPAVARDAGPRDAAPAVELPDASSAVLEACGDPPIVEGDFSRERLRGASADCAIHRYCVARAAARALETAVTAYADDPSEAKLSAARAAWQTTMQVWSQAELFQFGPAASAAESAGKDTFQGRGLRDKIYAWPASSRCRVEEQIAAQPRNIEPVLISGRGLFAIEYALFFAGDDSGCAAGSQTAKAWLELDAADRDQRKRSYARAVASDVRKQAEALYDAWSPDGGNFKQTFVSASGYPDEQTALNVLGWALVYIEKEVKDWKLGIPAGYTLSSPVSGPETPFAHVGTQALQANLRGFRALFAGCGSGGQGLGFDDWLRAAGHPELADELLEALSGAETGLEQLGPLHSASPAQIEAAYQALRQLTDLMKGDLFGAGSPLNLKLPSSVEGDTD